MKHTAWLASLALLLGACGGSSSETPFPIEPDFSQMDAGGTPDRSNYVVFTGRSGEGHPLNEDGGTPVDEEEPLPER